MSRMLPQAPQVPARMPRAGVGISRDRAVYVRDWRAANPLRRRASRAVSRRHDTEGADLTTKQWEAMLQAANGICSYCGTEQRLQLDHVLPLSRGGRHTLTNVVPACADCNMVKNSKTVAEWLDPTARATFQIRHARLVEEVRTWPAT